MKSKTRFHFLRNPTRSCTYVYNMCVSRADFIPNLIKVLPFLVLWNENNIFLSSHSKGDAHSRAAAANRCHKANTTFYRAIKKGNQECSRSMRRLWLPDTVCVAGLGGQLDRNLRATSELTKLLWEQTMWSGGWMREKEGSDRNQTLVLLGRHTFVQNLCVWIGYEYSTKKLSMSPAVISGMRGGN